MSFFAFVYIYVNSEIDHKITFGDYYVFLVNAIHSDKGESIEVKI